MIDTHCHLSYPPLFDRLDDVLAHARAVGVGHLITIGTRLADSLTCRDLAVKYAQISCAVGIHPHHAAETSIADLDQIIAMFADDHVCAAGEMGLDYHYDFSPREQQLTAFERQVAGAKAAGKPVVIHSRESIDDCLAILKSSGTSAGVFHCFTGQVDEARKILDAGFYLGFTGIITFKKSDDLREIVKMVPGDRLLIETDAPYLAPEPFRRQKTNEPSLIVHTFRKAAELRGVSQSDFTAQTSANAARLFGPLLLST